MVTVSSLFLAKLYPKLMQFKTIFWIAQWCNDFLHTFFPRELFPLNLHFFKEKHGIVIMISATSFGGNMNSKTRPKGK